MFYWHSSGGVPPQHVADMIHTSLTPNGALENAASEEFSFHFRRINNNNGVRFKPDSERIMGNIG